MSTTKTKTAKSKGIDLINTDVAANILGYASAASFRLMYNRERPFPCYRIAKRIMFDRAAVMAYIESQKVDAVELFPTV